MKKSTSELLEILKNTKSISDYLEREEQGLLSTKNLNDCLNEWMEVHSLKKSDVIRRSGLDRGYAYDILAGKKEPARDKALALCIAMGMTAEDVQKLLKSTGYPSLYARNERDSIILFSLGKALSLDETNELLYELGQECIG